MPNYQPEIPQQLIWERTQVQRQDFGDSGSCNVGGGVSTLTPNGD